MADLITILLVDDDAKNLMVLESILDSPDYRLVKASSADETLLALMETPCAAIIMDVQMPDMSGIELAQLIKQRKKTQHIPILFLTAHYFEDEHIMQGYDVGAVDYITKPVNPAILRSKISVFVDLFRKTLALTRANDELAVKNVELQRAADERARRIQAESARAEAEAANNAKDRFLAMLSHELRTPLSPVLHAAVLIEESEDCTPPVRDLVETIKRNVQLEARLIDDLLDLARIRTGKLQLQLEYVDAHDLLRRAAQICRPDILQRKLDLQVNLEATNSHLHADPARIQQIFWNLINNAVKYTGPGGHIILSTRDDDASNRLRIDVTDTGIGIPPDRLGRIFDAFEQGQGDRFSGLGLGLAIGRVLTGMHGGSIEAASAGLGHGSVFTVFLPVTTEHPRNAAPSSAPSSGASLPLRILLVEDHHDTAASLTHLLTKRGYRVRAAGSIREALEAMSQDTFDVLVSDLGLPDGRGIDLMQPFKTFAGDRPIAGVVLSGYGMPDDVKRTREAGFSDHLTKPIRIAELQRSLQSIAEKHFLSQSPA